MRIGYAKQQLIHSSFPLKHHLVRPDIRPSWGKIIKPLKISISNLIVSRPARTTMRGNIVVPFAKTKTSITGNFRIPPSPDSSTLRCIVHELMRLSIAETMVTCHSSSCTAISTRLPKIGRIFRIVIFLERIKRINALLIFEFLWCYFIRCTMFLLISISMILKHVMFV